MHAPTLTPVNFLENALARVESVSIKSWATSSHNRPIFLQMAENALAKGGQSADPVRFATYITCLAMGL